MRVYGRCCAATYSSSAVGKTQWAVSKAPDRALHPADRPLENDLAVVKVRELGAMADADDARMLELACQKHHQSILARGIERGGRLVEHDDVRAVEQDARE